MNRWTVYRPVFLCGFLSRETLVDRFGTIREDAPNPRDIESRRGDTEVLLPFKLRGPVVVLSAGQFVEIRREN